MNASWRVGGTEEGKPGPVETETDGIVYLLWPRLDFQSLTCCNLHSAHSSRRVAQTSHTFLFLRLLCFPTNPSTLPGIVRSIFAWEKLQVPDHASHKFIRGPPHTLPDGTSRVCLKTNSKYRFCYFNISLSLSLARLQTLSSNSHTWYSFQNFALCSLRSLVKNRIWEENTASGLISWWPIWWLYDSKPDKHIQIQI